MTTIYLNTCVQGYVYRGISSGATWANIIGGNGTGSLSAPPYGSMRPTLVIKSKDAGVPDTAWLTLSRGIFFIDSTYIPDGVTITAASLISYTSNINDLGLSPSVNIYNVSTLYDGRLDASDYQNCGTTPLSTAKTWGQVDSGSQTFVLNQDGIDEIDPTDITKFCIRFVDHDVNGDEPVVTLSNSLTQLEFTSSFQLKVTYTETVTLPPTETPTPTPTATPSVSGKWTGNDWSSMSKIRANTIGAGDLECGVDLS